MNVQKRAPPEEKEFWGAARDKSLRTGCINPRIPMGQRTRPGIEAGLVLLPTLVNPYLHPVPASGDESQIKTCLASGEGFVSSRH